MTIIAQTSPKANAETIAPERAELRHDHVYTHEWIWSEEGLGIGLTSADAYVYARILETTQVEEDAYRETQEHLAATLDLHPNTVAAALARLRAKRLVVRCSHRCGLGQPDRYCVDQGAADAAARRVMDSSPRGVFAEVSAEEWMWASVADGGLGLRIGTVALAVYATVYGVTRYGKGLFARSQTSLAARLGVTRRAVNAALRDLEERGLVVSAGDVKLPGRRATKSYEVVQARADRAMASVLRTSRRVDAGEPAGPFDPYARMVPADPVATATAAMIDVSPQRMDEERADRVAAGVRRLAGCGVRPTVTQVAYDLYRRWLRRRSQTGERVRVLQPDQFLEGLSPDALLGFLGSAHELLYGRPMDEAVRELAAKKAHPKSPARRRQARTRAA